MSLAGPLVDDHCSNLSLKKWSGLLTWPGLEPNRDLETMPWLQGKDAFAWRILCHFTPGRQESWLYQACSHLASSTYIFKCMRKLRLRKDNLSEVTWLVRGSVGWPYITACDHLSDKMREVWVGNLYLMLGLKFLWAGKRSLCGEENMEPKGSQTLPGTDPLRSRVTQWSSSRRSLPENHNMARKEIP